MQKVVIYTGDLCIHYNWAIDLLNRKKIKFTEYNVAKDSSKMEEMFKKSNGAKTVPQIFIGEHHVGGNAELQILEKNGKIRGICFYKDLIENPIFGFSFFTISSPNNMFRTFSKITAVNTGLCIGFKPDY